MKVQDHLQPYSKDKASLDYMRSCKMKKRRERGRKGGRKGERREGSNGERILLTQLAEHLSKDSEVQFS